MASPIQWTWFWVNSRSWWWTGRPGVLWSMGLQRVRHHWVTELNCIYIKLPQCTLKILQFCQLYLDRTMFFQKVIFQRMSFGNSLSFWLRANLNMKEINMCSEQTFQSWLYNFFFDCTTFKISHPICNIKYTKKKRVRDFLEISLENLWPCYASWMERFGIGRGEADELVTPSAQAYLGYFHWDYLKVWSMFIAIQHPETWFFHMPEN